MVKVKTPEEIQEEIDQLLKAQRERVAALKLQKKRAAERILKETHQGFIEKGTQLEEHGIDLNEIPIKELVSLLKENKSRLGIDVKETQPADEADRDMTVGHPDGEVDEDEATALASAAGNGGSHFSF